MRRLGISLLVVVLLATIGFGWAIDRLFVELSPASGDRFEAYRQTAASLLTALPDPAELARAVDAWPQENGAQLRLMDASALVLPPELQREIASGSGLTLQSDSGVALYFQVANSDQVLAITPPPENNIGTPLRFVLTILFYAGLILLILIWLFPLARRLHALTRTANAFGAGRLDARVQTHRHSYLGEIESAFNTMAGRIENLVADNKLLSSAVSHDLRTPLARLRFGLDAINEETDASVRDQYLLRLSNDLTSMEQLVEVLLEYARLDQQLSDVPLKNIDLIQHVDRSVEAMHGVVSQRIDWLGHSQPVCIHANARYLDMLINNLIQNAVNHGQNHVRVRVEQRHDRVRFTVGDDGPGIPEQDRADVIKPFTRGQGQGESRTGSSGHKGFGMGLAIVSRIAEWHGAELEIGSDRELGGASLSVSFRGAECSEEN